MLRRTVLTATASSSSSARSGRVLEPVLAREAIAAALDVASCEVLVDVLDVVDSTSSELLRRAAEGDIHRRAVVAESQTAGRGRRGSQWTSIAGGSLTFSLGWRFAQGATDLTALPLAVGLALAGALEDEGFPHLGLKWPNDLVLKGRKLGGVLVELSGDGSGPSLAVIGIGLNIRLPRTVQRAIRQAATDLAAAAPERKLDRNAILAGILARLVRALETYASTGFAPLRAEWQRRHALHGKAVRVLRPDGAVVRGKVAGVDTDGALILSSAGRTLRFVSGEVSLRRP